MCGLVGYSGSGSASDMEIVSVLLRESKIRGLHAYGFSFFKDVLSTFKSFSLDEIVSLVIRAAPAELISHNRYCTSGDWVVMENNQPVTLGDFSLAFNGVIDMRNVREYSNDYPFDFQTENDGEIFIQSVLAGVDPAAFVREMSGSFAGLYFRSGSVYCVRNNRRPLHVSFVGKSVFVASTVDIFKRSKFNESEVFEIPPYEEIKINELEGCSLRNGKEQTRGLYFVPPRYGRDWRYRPRLSGSGLSVR